VTLVAVAVGGGLGAVARYALEGAIARRQKTPFPLSTLVVNVSGSLLLGAFVAATLSGSIPSGAALWVSTGFFGGYTTFSTFVYETVRLVEDDAWYYALWNVAFTGPLSFVAAAGGYLLLAR
jgi:fluoride exporter